MSTPLFETQGVRPRRSGYGSYCRYISRIGVATTIPTLLAVGFAQGDVVDECGARSRPDRAVVACSQLLEAFQNSWSAHYNRGVAYRTRGDTDEAMHDFNAAIRLNPQASQPYYSRGRIHLDRNDFDQTIEDFSTSLAIRGNNPLAYNARAWARYKQGRLSDAMTDVNRAITFDPGYAAAYDTRAHIYEHQGRREEAIADYRKALALDPTNNLAHITRKGLERLGAKP